MSDAEHPIRTLVPRQDLTGADRTWAERFEVGDVLRYSRASKDTGIGKGEYAHVSFFFVTEEETATQPGKRVASRFSSSRCAILASIHAPDPA